MLWKDKGTVPARPGTVIFASITFIDRAVGFDSRPMSHDPGISRRFLPSLHPALILPLQTLPWR